MPHLPTLVSFHSFASDLAGSSLCITLLSWRTRAGAYGSLTVCQALFQAFYKNLLTNPHEPKGKALLSSSSHR